MGNTVIPDCRKKPLVERGATRRIQERGDGE
jgi:hypothetical protein